MYGLGYSLLVFVYRKTDDAQNQTARLDFQHVVFIDKEYTADYQTTFGITEILRRNGNLDDVVAFLEERHLPLDDVGRLALAERILYNPPRVGYLTISNALQWRLQYSRVITLTSQQPIEGAEDVRG